MKEKMSIIGFLIKFDVFLKYNQKFLGCNSCNANFVNGGRNFQKSALLNQYGSDIHGEALDSHEEEKSNQAGEK